jgi:transposase
MKQDNPSVKQQASCGVDVSKATLDVHLIPGNRTWQVANTPQGHQELIDQLEQPDLASVKVLLEATGGLERPLVAALAAKGVPVVVINPRQARRFAESLSANPAKTDRADARTLAIMCQSLNIPVRPLPSQEQTELNDLVSRRRQLCEMIGREKMRLGQAVSSKVRRDIQETIHWLEKRLKGLDDDLDKQMSTMQELQPIAEILCEEKGVGTTTARVLLACLPELGRLNNKQIASLAGVAPVARDSGKYSGNRHICGGRAEVRSALWMATFNARQKNEKIRPYFESLTLRGKHYKLAMVACMHKFLRILNAKVRRYLKTAYLPATPPTHSIASPC